MRSYVDRWLFECSIGSGGGESLKRLAADGTLADICKGTRSFQAAAIDCS